jgi:thymidine phosphorylase
MKIEVDINKADEPAGNGIGPYLEAIDVLKVLEQKKDRPLDLEARSIRLATRLLTMCYETAHIKLDPEKEIREVLKSGRALKKMKEIIKAQYGDPDVSSDSLKLTGHKKEILSAQSGTIRSIHNVNLNSIAKILGAPDDQQAGISIYKRKGDSVVKHESLLCFHSSSTYHLEEAMRTIEHFPIYTIES